MAQARFEEVPEHPRPSGGISLWAVGNDLRKGAALNTIQIAELFL